VRWEIARVIPVLISAMISYSSLAQTPSLLDAANTQALNLGRFSFPAADSQGTPAAPNDADSSSPFENRGLVRRGLQRILQDQKEVYLEPLERSNFGWDALLLAGTGALIATDRRIERHLPGGNVNMYSNASNIALGGTAGALAIMWGYGLKTHNEHLKETGSLEIETLVNAFLVYAPMQFIAGRQRPGEGNGHGDFGRHHMINTSFPAGHPMFTMAMATLVAHEYPRPWVKILAYGATATVIAGRFLGRDHWASDVFVGPALGYFIGSHIFHSRCNPEFNKGCHHPAQDRDQP
jgi:PAP2 superfamily protein